MAEWAEFHIRINGPSVDQQRVLLLFQQHKDRSGNRQTPWFFDFSESECKDQQLWFWSPDPWHQWKANTLVVHGEMKWIPPLVIVEKLAEMFPELTLDVTSNTEAEGYHQWYEHWRATCGQSLQLIEDLIIDVQSEAVARYWLREGEKSVFSLSNEEEAAE